MKISAKGRYALAAVTDMAQHYSTGEYITVISISERLGISKIYLEQVFSLLKRGAVVNSIKGSQGGYQLSRNPNEITLLDILLAVEFSLFEPAQDTVVDKAIDIDRALKATVFDSLDKTIKDTLSGITLLDLTNEVEKYKGEDQIMFYI